MQTFVAKWFPDTGRHISQLLRPRFMKNVRVVMMLLSVDEFSLSSTAPEGLTFYRGYYHVEKDVRAEDLH